MPKVSMTTELPAAAKQVWDTVGGFNQLPDWHPAVEKSEEHEENGVTVRTLTLVGGGTIVERLDKHDPASRTYEYSILSGPLPVANYTSTVKVTEGKDGACSVEWSSDFEASGAPENDAVATIQGVYQAGLDNLKKMFGG